MASDPVAQRRAACDNAQVKNPKSCSNSPLSMSTSPGSWDGAMSDGTKTVWDAWGNDQKFALVRFFTPKAP